ncbi:MAG: hypothetical protein E7299_04940 [Lachnospiraceae bacterium]|nr:hypothetical protein [Lachnospiraceae bacterium]
MNVDLNSIGGGALQARFNREMEKVVKNMKDPNTPYKDVRKITITLAFKQDEERNAAACTVEVTSKLAKAKSFETNFGIGQDLKTNQYLAKEYHNQIPGQMGFEDVKPVTEENSNVKEFNGQKLSRAIGG